MDVSALELRKGQLSATLNAMDGCWPHVAAELARRREAMIANLIVADNQELRGRIKQIDDLLLLPQYLRMEIQNLSNALPE